MFWYWIKEPFSPTSLNPEYADWIQLGESPMAAKDWSAMDHSEKLADLNERLMWLQGAVERNGKMLAHRVDAIGEAVAGLKHEVTALKKKDES